MTNKITPQTVKAAFPPDIPIPARLQALVDAQNAGDLDIYDLPGDFELDLKPVDDKADWFAQPTTPSALYAARQLAAFGRGGDGSVFAIWKAPTGGFPVVYLESEGDSRTLACDFDQFLRLIAADDWERDEDDPEDEERDPAFRAWVRAQGLDIPESGEDITYAAEYAYQELSGWCDEATEGTLSAETAMGAQTAKPPAAGPTGEAAPADADLWTLIIGAIGQRIDSPVVQALLQKIGAKPFKPATPNDNWAWATAKQFGIQMTAQCKVTHRAYWPARKEGRTWVTYVTDIALEPPYPGPLPLGLDWAISEAALNAIGPKKEGHRGDLDWVFWDLPVPRSDIVFRAHREEPRACGGLTLRLDEEWDYINASADYEEEKPLVYVEAAFFATWCALHGLLRADKFTPEIIQPWRERRMTPLQFLHGPCGRLLWSGDLVPEFKDFVSVYYRGDAPEEKRWGTDRDTVFGTSNHFRRDGEAMTADDWATFDRIAPLIEKRYREWQRGELKKED